MIYTLHDGTIVDLDDDDIAMIFNDKCNNIIKVWFVEDLANHKSRSEKEHNFIVENTKPIYVEYEKFYWNEGPIPHNMYAFNVALVNAKHRIGYYKQKE